MTTISFMAVAVSGVSFGFAASNAMRLRRWRGRWLQHCVWTGIALGLSVVSCFL